MSTMALKLKNVRPDAKGRITLGHLADGVSSYSITQDEDRLILEPQAEVPAREKWLFENPEALASLKRGLADSAAGRVKYLGDFSKYLDEDDKDTE